MELNYKIFQEPCNPDIKIWRYMDFDKYKYLMNEGALYFSRSDRLKDLFEGSYPAATSLLYKSLSKQHDKIENFLSEAKAFRKFVAVNCWHINDSESLEMWKRYVKSGEGVVVQTTYSRLLNSFSGYKDDNIYCGKVNYIDFAKAPIPLQPLVPFAYKQLVYSYEKELRCLICRPPIKNGKFDWSLNMINDGIPVSIQIEKLIEYIYVAPNAPAGFDEMVKSALDKNSGNKKLIRRILPSIFRNT